jgi:Big-like domain-containing protein
VPDEPAATASITNPTGKGKAVRRLKIFTMVAGAAGAALVAAVMTASPASADTNPTTTTLTLASNRVVFGFEGSFTMQVGVNAFDGSWSITAGSPATGSIPLCGGNVSNGTSCTMPAGALPPGNYNLVAVYSGSENSSPSASGLVPLTVIAQQPTTTSLTLFPDTVIAGQEQSEDLGLRVTGDTGNSAAGPVTVLAGSTPLSLCTNIEVIGVGDCSLTASELPPGTYQLTARFDGSQNFAGSTSAPQTLTVVAQQPTTTSLTLSAPSVPFANEQTETLTATVTPATSGTPTGHVTVTSGSTPVCTIALASATGTCTLTASQLPPGSYPLTATYNGDSLNLTSADTTQTLTVAKEPTTTDLTLSADTIARGSEQAELFTVQVTPATSGTPTGNVTVKAGATAVCTIILSNATGNCTLTPNQLARGTHQITATYNGAATYAKSTSSPPQTLTVTRPGTGVANGATAADGGHVRPLTQGRPW